MSGAGGIHAAPVTFRASLSERIFRGSAKLVENDFDNTFKLALLGGGKMIEIVAHLHESSGILSVLARIIDCEETGLVPGFDPIVAVR